MSGMTGAEFRFESGTIQKVGCPHQLSTALSFGQAG